MIIKITIKNYKKETPELKETFKKLGLTEFDSLSFQFKNISAGDYEIGTNHMFANQYNTTCGLRIFEKCTSMNFGNKGNKKKYNGYYISEGIEKIREYQKRVKVCHYCGKQYIDSDLEWCTDCHASEYLDAKSYHLLKLTNVCEKYASSKTVIPEKILKSIESSRKKARLERAKKRNIDTLESLQKNIKKAEHEYKVHQYLINININVDNVIYYDHTNTFCFGWRDSLSGVEKIELKKKLINWPFENKISYK